MIKLIDHGETHSLIEFTPRYVKRRYPQLERQLVYGYHCPRCQNVIQAYFITDKPVDLMIYEETNILSESTINRGHIEKKIPNKDDDYSCYESVFHETAQGNGQMIRLRNHTLNWAGWNKKEKWFETGERPCNMVGWKPISEKTYTRDLETIYGHVANMGFNPPTSEFIRNWLNKTLDFEITGGSLVIKPVGQALPMIMVKRHMLRDDALPVALPQALKKAWAKHVAKQEENLKKEDNMSVSVESETEEHEAAIG